MSTAKDMDLERGFLRPLTTISRYGTACREKRQKVLLIVSFVVLFQFVCSYTPMVRISRQRLVASRPGGRLRGAGKQPPEAVYGAAGLLGMVLLFGFYFTWLSGREGGGSDGTASTSSYNNVAGSAPLRRNHPQLQIPDKNTDQCKCKPNPTNKSKHQLCLNLCLRVP